MLLLGNHPHPRYNPLSLVDLTLHSCYTDYVSRSWEGVAWHEGNRCFYDRFNIRYHRKSSRNILLDN